MSKIVITGMGAVTPIGIGVDNYWNNLIGGKCGIDRIQSFDASELAVQIAGEVKDFNPSDYLPKDVVRKTDAFMQYAYIAAEEALKQSGIEIEPERIGIVMGTALSGISTIAFTQEALTGASHKKVGPRFIPKILGNIAAANIAIAHNIQGPSYTVSTACSSGGDAINQAAMIMKAGKADAMIAVGAESAHCPIFIYSLANAKALSRNNENPKTASRPFDEARDGFVIGEGGGALILETEEYINAHGTSTPKGDEVETKAVAEVFGNNPPLVSSTKGATGHMMGAGGITEVIACIKAIETGIIPPTINLENPIPDCKIDFVPNEPRKADISYAMSNAFGFGGQNSSVIVGRYE